MLTVRLGGMTEDEYRTEVSLSALLAAPLIVTSDVRQISPEAGDLN